MQIEHRIERKIETLLERKIIRDRRFLDDEQLFKDEQFKVLKEIFDVNVRQKELDELSAHFTPIFRADHPIHLSVLGKTGTGKTVTILYFLNLIKNLCVKKKIPIRYEYLDLTTPKPCFRALNDLACFLDASKRYKKGISLDELMCRIENKILSFDGYLVLLVDEIDHVRRDLDSFLKFLVKRLPQRVNVRLVLIFTSNKLNWMENIDPRVKSFLKVNEMVFNPYDAMDLRKILSLRIEKALHPSGIGEGVVEKIAAISSRTHGDARKAVELLCKSAYLAEKGDSAITVDFVDQALAEIEQNKYVAMIRASPKQLQAALFSIISIPTAPKKILHTGDAYARYRAFCEQIALRALTQRAFSDLVSELDMCGFVQARVKSHGRYGRTKEIIVHLSPDLITKLKQVVLMEFDLNPR